MLAVCLNSPLTLPFSHLPVPRGNLQPLGHWRALQDMSLTGSLPCLVPPVVPLGPPIPPQATAHPSLAPASGASFQSPSNQAPPCLRDSALAVPEGLPSPQSSLSLSLSLRSPAEPEHPQGSLPVIPKSRSLSYQFPISIPLFYLSNSLSCGCLLLWKLQGGTQVLLQFVPSVPRAQHSAWSRPPHSVLVPLTMDTSPLRRWRQLTARSCCRPPREAVRGMTASRSP